MILLHHNIHLHHTHSHAHTKHVDMLHGNLLKKILLFALPLSLSSILQQVFNSADVAVVGHFVGPQAMAAVGSNSPIINLLINLFVGISVGANVVIARHIGQNESDKARQTVKTSLFVSLISGVFLSVVGALLAHPMLKAIDTPPDVIELAASYLRIYFLGMPAFMFFNFGAAVLRSVGDTRRPLISLLLCSILNAVLNVIFVAGFGLGVEGVAVATVIANCVCAGMVAHWLAHEDEPIRWTYKDLAIDRNELIPMLKVGVPAGLQGMVFSLSNLFIQAAINSHGSAAVAGSSAALIYECIAWLAVSGFTQAAVTFTSQNYGARQYDRCKKILKLCLICSFVGCAFLTLVFVGGRDMFIALFTNDPNVAHYAELRMLWVLMIIPIAVFYEIPGGALRGMGYSMTPTVITILGTCVFRLAWIFNICPKYTSFEALMVVYPISWIITGIATVIAYNITSRKAFQPTAETPQLPKNTPLSLQTKNWRTAVRINAQ